MSNDLEYFTRRNRQEEEQAKRTVEPSARKAHQQLAQLHRERVGEALEKASQEDAQKTSSAA